MDLLETMLFSFLGGAAIALVICVPIIVLAYRITWRALRDIDREDR